MRDQEPQCDKISVTVSSYISNSDGLLWGVDLVQLSFYVYTSYFNIRQFRTRKFDCGRCTKGQKVALSLAHDLKKKKIF